jgi:Tfp pilus assembly pilus retraction ATPase PilT
LLTELTQILEMSNVNITSLHLEHQNPAYVDVQISLDAQELKHLLPTLRRFGYEVLSKHPEDDLEEKLQVNSSYLDKYLSI